MASSSFRLLLLPALLAWSSSAESPATRVHSREARVVGFFNDLPLSSCRVQRRSLTLPVHRWPLMNQAAVRGNVQPEERKRAQTER